MPPAAKLSTRDGRRRFFSQSETSETVQSEGSYVLDGFMKGGVYARRRMIRIEDNASIRLSDGLNTYPWT